LLLRILSAFCGQQIFYQVKGFATKTVEHTFHWKIIGTSKNQL
jgi:hypothetical protein